MVLGSMLILLGCRVLGFKAEGLGFKVWGLVRV